MLSSTQKAVITLDQVSKRYQLGAMVPFPLNIAHDFWQRLRGKGKLRKDFWALRDVSFEVYPGEVLGIIGPNGAGKSTILKLLAGVTQPTHGSVMLEGKLSALIELGAGFHPELSGRENIYLNGAVLGMRRQEIDQILDQIIAFSGLEAFIDTPVKRYSSGMYARLGFSVAVHVNPDILLVDEVLSVGDLAFQQKSLRKMLSFKEQAKAMVFVSHNLVAVQQLCDRVVWLERGSLVDIGPPDSIIRQYQSRSAKEMLQAQSDDYQQGKLDEEGGVSIVKTEVFGAENAVVRTAQPWSIHISIEQTCLIEDLVCSVAIYRYDGMKLSEMSNFFDEVYFDNEIGNGLIILNLTFFPFVPGDYYLNVALSNKYLAIYDHVAYATHFSVEGTSRQIQAPGPLWIAGEWHYKAD
jgi:ABC-type polysaccharide/polyol phosphate transport system ATPase subunit